MKCPQSARNYAKPGEWHCFNKKKIMQYNLRVFTDTNSVICKIIVERERLLLEEKLSAQLTDEVETKLQNTSSDLADARPPSPQGEGF